MHRVVLETFTMRGGSEGIWLDRELTDLPSGEDPLALVSGDRSEGYAHSTSWRWSGDAVVLTFVVLLPDTPHGMVADVGDFMSVADLERTPVACHAVRHLHFLRHTDDEVAALADCEAFWRVAESVADHHYPAVAGLLNRVLGDEVDFVI